MKCDKKDLLLYAVTDRSWLNGKSLAQQVDEVLKGGATMLQLREKDMNRDAFKAEAVEIKKICDRYHVPLIINDNVDLAVEVGATGVRVGQHDMEAGQVRERVGADVIVGVSARTIKQALAAQNMTGVKSIQEATPELLADQLDCVFTDIFPDAVKTGMVSSIPLIQVIASKLKEYGEKSIDVDPVMVPTSGSPLLSAGSGGHV